MRFSNDDVDDDYVHGNHVIYASFSHLVTFSHFCVELFHVIDDDARVDRKILWRHFRRTQNNKIWPLIISLWCVSSLILPVKCCKIHVYKKRNFHLHTLLRKRHEFYFARSESTSFDIWAVNWHLDWYNECWKNNIDNNSKENWYNIRPWTENNNLFL